MNKIQKNKLAVKMFSLLTVCALSLMGTGSVSADFVSWNNQTGFSSLNTSDSTGVDVFVVSNLNTESVSSVVAGSSETGNNTSDNNTGDGSVDSGLLNIAGVILNDLNSNLVENLAGWWSGLFSAGNDTTGANSDNQANTNVDSTVVASDVNELSLTYEVSVDGSTGNNTADDNTGSGDVETGGVAGLLTATDMANSNEIMLNGDLGNNDFSSLAENVDTGSDSNNESNTSVLNTMTVDNLNSADVENLMFVSVNTGGNSASDNTGEGSSVMSGNAIWGISIENEYNSNSTEMEVSSGNGNVEAVNDTTGSDSFNSAEADLINTITVVNDNSTGISNSTEVSLDTGNNSADDNTGSGDVQTGNATGIISIDNGSGLNSNTTMIDSGMHNADVLASNNTTGSESDNEASAVLDNTVTVDNNNDVDISNEVSVSSATGNNTADDNTGDGSVDTGNASGTALIVNNANSNDTTINLSSSVSLEASNDTTGANSDNSASASASNVVVVSNNNESVVTNDVVITSDSGNNSSDNNTGDGSVSTGSASMTFGISNNGNSNTTEIGQ